MQVVEVDDEVFFDLGLVGGGTGIVSADLSDPNSKLSVFLGVSRLGRYATWVFGETDPIGVERVIRDLQADGRDPPTEVDSGPLAGGRASWTESEGRWSAEVVPLRLDDLPELQATRLSLESVDEPSLDIEAFISSAADVGQSEVLPFLLTSELIEPACLLGDDAEASTVQARMDCVRREAGSQSVEGWLAQRDFEALLGTC